MSSKDIAQALNSASEIAALGIAAGGPVGIVATIASLALKAGAAIALAGGDPVKEITRILSSTPGVTDIHTGWEKLIDKEFGSSTVPSPPPVGRLKSEPPPPMVPPGFPPPQPGEVVATIPTPPPPSPTIDEDPTPPAGPPSSIYDED